MRTPAARWEWNPARRTSPGPTAESKRPRKVLLHISAILQDRVLCAVPNSWLPSRENFSSRARALEGPGLRGFKGSILGAECTGQVSSHSLTKCTRVMIVFFLPGAYGVVTVSHPSQRREHTAPCVCLIILKCEASSLDRPSILSRHKCAQCGACAAGIRASSRDAAPVPAACGSAPRWGTGVLQALAAVRTR